MVDILLIAEVVDIKCKTPTSMIEFCVCALARDRCCCMNFYQICQTIDPGSCFQGTPDICKNKTPIT